MGIKIIANNKKARFDFTVVETFEAGLALRGSEVKSLRAGSCNLKDSYVSFKGNEAFLQKAHIPEFQASSYNNHEPERLRKLLMHKQELVKIFANIRERGYSCVPLKIYFKGGRVKLEIALVKGKKHQDKRQDLKAKDAKRDIARQLKRNR